MTRLKAEYSNAKIILGGDFNDDYFNPNGQDETLYKEHIKAFSNIEWKNYESIRDQLETLIKTTPNLINVFQDNPQSTNYFSKPKEEGLLTHEKFIEQGKRIDFLFTDMASTESKIDEEPTKLTTTENTNKPIKEKNKAPNLSEHRRIVLVDPSTGKPNPLLTDENFHQFGDHNALQAVLKKPVEAT